MPKRLIGKYTQGLEGPLLFVISQMHGNEPAGRIALEYMFKMLEVEPITNPSFIFKGTIIGVTGNLQAAKLGMRFIKKDLNRAWHNDDVERIKKTPKSELDAEDLEMKEILNLVTREIKASKSSEVIFLDLHTTSSFGGIFSIPTDDDKSLKIAKELHAPVVKGMLNGISGSLLHYFNTENLGITTTMVAFESGQHEEPLSVNRAIAAITNCMRSVGCVEASHIENRHDEILVEFSKDLPKVCDLIGKISVINNEKFSLIPGLKNFQRIEKDQYLGIDEGGEIRASEDSLILMPRYQKQGDDGFFLIKKAED
jgi:succinylglutamate desuccinylase